MACSSCYRVCFVSGGLVLGAYMWHAVACLLPSRLNHAKCTPSAWSHFSMAILSQCCQCQLIASGSNGFMLLSLLHLLLFAKRGKSHIHILFVYTYYISYYIYIYVYIYIYIHRYNLHTIHTHTLTLSGYWLEGISWKHFLFPQKKKMLKEEHV